MGRYRRAGAVRGRDSPLVVAVVTLPGVRGGPESISQAALDSLSRRRVLLDPTPRRDDTVDAPDTRDLPFSPFGQRLRTPGLNLFGFDPHL